MTRAPLRFLLCLSLFLVCLDLNASDLQRLQTALEADTTIEEPQRSELANLLSDIPLQIGQAAEIEAEATRLRDQAAQSGREIKRMESELAVDSAVALQRWRSSLDEDAPIEALDLRLQQLLADAEQARQEAQKVASERALLLQKPAAKALGSLQLEVADLEQKLGTARRTTNPDLATQILVESLSAQLANHRAELARWNTELDTASSRRVLLDLRQRSLRRKVSDNEQRAEALQTVIAARRSAEVSALATKAQQQAEQVAQSLPSLGSAAATSVSLANELIERGRHLDDVRGEAQRANALRNRLDNALRDTETRLSLGDTSEAVGAILMRERRDLPNPDRLLRQVRDLTRQTTELRLRQFDMDDAMTAVVTEQDRSLGESLATLRADGQSEAAVKATIKDLYELRNEILQRLDLVLQNELDQAQTLQTNLAEAAATASSLKSLLDQQLFWIPSHRAIGMSWFADLADGFGRVFSPTLWRGAIRDAWSRAREAPLQIALGSLLCLLAFAAGTRGKQQLVVLGESTAHASNPQFGHTWRAWIGSVIAASPWAFLVFMLARLLQMSGEPGKFTHALGAAALEVSGLMLALSFLSIALIPNGLAEVHFQWSDARRKALQQALPWARGLLLPLQLLAALTFLRGESLSLDTAGRVWVMAAALVGLGGMIWLLAPGKLWTQHHMQGDRSRLRKLSRLCLGGLLGLILLLSLRGYVFSANLLLDSVAESALLFLLVSQTHALLARWILIGERRIALREAQRQLLAQAETPEQTGEAVPEQDPAQVDIQSINTQTQRLLRAVSATLLVVGLLWVWSDVLPAVQKLDELKLWRFSDIDEDGSKIIDFVTLKGLLFGIAILTLTTIAARNLPGLLEIGLLSRMNMDAASRYAISSLSRYAIVISGVIFGLSWLGMRWSQLQWMAAALTVGLGFGLQEIFANFVSGIILLFERPFRVGDVITIGEFSGTVTRIRTRATTLLDFDNKEIVVPNKSFITDRLTNWTLSDTTTRVIVKVGVAYGSPVDRVHELLMQAAAECPWVLSQPPARSWFMALGASSLDFELRVFVATLEQRFQAVNFLNARITRLMGDAAIEIAFPQVDVHLRQDTPILSKGLESSEERARPFAG
ncbi:MAG: mechanosensitive ion channel [Lysobacteraceae bacterium]